MTHLKRLLVRGGVTGPFVALLMIARRVSHEHVFARALPHHLLLLVFAVGYVLVFTGGTAAPVGAGVASLVP